MYSPYLSAIVADQPLSPATRHRLGRPLPHQQADRTQTPPSAASYGLSPSIALGTYLGISQPFG